MQVKDKLITLEELGAAYNNITPANIGAVAKSGDTMTGRLFFLSESGVYKNASPYFYFLRDNSLDSENKLAAILCSASTVNNKKVADRLYFRHYSHDDNGDGIEQWENYLLPKATANLTSSGTYDILTSKNAVTVAQGGTGATTAPGARVNLDAAAFISLDSNDNTVALIYNKLNRIVTGEVATVHITGAVLNMLTGKEIGVGVSGTVYRGGNTSNDFNFDVFRNNGASRWSFSTTVTSSKITAGNVYQYSGTAL